MDSHVRRAAELRRRAEAMALGNAIPSPENLEALSPEDTRQTLHDLRVHQIELEMQNEELHRTQAELDAARARYFDLYDLAPVGYCTLSEQGLILEANLTAATLLGVARGALVKQPLSRSILLEDQDIYYLQRKQLFETGEPQACELRLLRPDRPPFWGHLEATAAQDADGTPTCRVALSDITERKRAEALRESEERFRRVSAMTSDIAYSWAERKQAEKALWESEERFRRLVETSPDANTLTDLDGNLLMCNQQAATLHGFESSEAMLGMNAMEFFPPEERPRACENMQKTQTDGLIKDVEYTMLRRDGSCFPAESSAALIQGADGNPQFLMAITRDITKRKQAEEALAREATSLAQAEAISHVGSWRLVLETGEITWSDETYSIFGLARVSFSHDVGEAVALAVHPEDRAKLDELNSAVLRDGLPRPADYRIVHPDGAVRWVHTQGEQERDETGRVVALVGFVQDITERKQAEEALRALLAEKEVLLKEVYHRVKNNLTAIIGLVNLHQAGAADPATSALLAELEGRIRSMALVHESLYQAEDLAHVSLQDYIETLIAQVRASLAPRGDVRCRVEAAYVEMGPDTAIPCGLILNELITNAFKYAFPCGQPRPGEKACEITVSAERDGGAGDSGAYTLVVADNGVGFPAELDWAIAAGTGAKTLGLRLVGLLVRHQLAGTIEIDRAGGTRFTLKFKPRHGR